MLGFGFCGKKCRKVGFISKNTLALPRLFSTNRKNPKPSAGDLIKLIICPSFGSPFDTASSAEIKIDVPNDFHLSLISGGNRVCISERSLS